MKPTTKRAKGSEFGEDLRGESFLDGFLLLDGNLGALHGDVEGDVAFLDAKSGARTRRHGGVEGVIAEAANGSYGCRRIVLVFFGHGAHLLHEGLVFVVVVGGTENDLETLATDQASASLNPGAGLQDGGRPERSADSDAGSGTDPVLGEKRADCRARRGPGVQQQRS